MIIHTDETDRGGKVLQGWGWEVKPSKDKLYMPVSAYTSLNV